MAMLAVHYIKNLLWQLVLVEVDDLADAQVIAFSEDMTNSQLTRCEGVYVLEGEGEEGSSAAGCSSSASSSSSLVGSARASVVGFGADQLLSSTMRRAEVREQNLVARSSREIKRT